MNEYSFTAEELANIADRVVEAEQQRTYWEQQVKLLKSQLSYLPVGKHRAGVYSILVRSGARRLAPERVEDKYPPDRYPDFYKPAIRSEVLRQRLSQDELEAVTVRSSPSVTVT